MERPKFTRPFGITLIAAIFVVLVMAVLVLGQQTPKQDLNTITEKLQTNAKLTGEAPVDTTNVSPKNDAITEPPQNTSVEDSPEEPVQEEAFAEYARIKTWYSGGGFSSETAWVHFKAVDAEGKTIKEVLGSDQMNMRKEQDALDETSKRRELVDQLRKDMTSDGWKEVGVTDGGEWYEYKFGR